MYSYYYRIVVYKIISSSMQYTSILEYNTVCERNLCCAELVSSHPDVSQYSGFFRALFARGLRSCGRALRRGRAGARREQEAQGGCEAARAHQAELCRSTRRVQGEPGEGAADSPARGSGNAVSHLMCLHSLLNSRSLLELQRSPWAEGM